MNRPTIRDVAAAAGVSPGAASFALNGRPGVSEDTRQRVQRVAAELGWTRNPAAVALSVQRAQAVGLVISRPEESFTGERFFMRLIAGIERVLTANAHSLSLQFVTNVDDEAAVYNRWWAEKRVDGVILTDPRADDPRPAMLKGLGLPAVYAGAQASAALPGVVVDDGAAMVRLVDHFADVGHHRLAHVRGSADLLHTRRRSEEFEARCADRGIDVVPTSSTDFTEEAGTAVTEQLLASSAGPLGIIYDNEVLMLGGLVAIVRANVAIPGDVAIASFEDTPLCRISRPQITALVRDPAELGAHATELLLKLLAGEPAAEVTEPTMDLAVRGSTDRSATQ